MRPMRPSRQFVYTLALAVILLSLQIVSQTQSSPPPSTNPTTASKANTNTGKVNYSPQARRSETAASERITPTACLCICGPTTFL
jgi:hypothetical protein